MELEACLAQTKATRAFTDQPITDETLRVLVDAARRAGSGHNVQPWSFIALRDDDRRQRLADFGEYTSPLREAPLGIVIAMDVRDTDRLQEHTVFDCGRAAQNLILAATDRGLGTVPQGIHDRDGAATFLELPDEKRPLIGLAVGYPDRDAPEEIEGVPKEEELTELGRRPVDEILHHERYGGG